MNLAPCSLKENTTIKQVSQFSVKPQTKAAKTSKVRFTSNQLYQNMLRFECAGKTHWGQLQWQEPLCHVARYNGISARYKEYHWLQAEQQSPHIHWPLLPWSAKHILHSSSNRGPDPDADTSPESHQPLPLQTFQVKRPLLNIICNKETGPDGCFRTSTESMCSWACCSIHIHLQSVTTASHCPHLPKNCHHTITNMNDYRPVALAPVIIKFYERLVLPHNFKRCMELELGH